MHLFDVEVKKPRWILEWSENSPANGYYTIMFVWFQLFHFHGFPENESDIMSEKRAAG